MDRRNVLDIIAYYLSEYDTHAFNTLGFETQAKGFETIAGLYGKKSSYLRRLRDEYDVVTNSARRGQRNREPRARIIQTRDYLYPFSFDELTDIVKAFIENSAENGSQVISSENTITVETEAEIENILNFKDTGATILVKSGDSKIRIYNTAIIKQLKKLYGGKCQLCGSTPFPNFNVGLSEAHHIAYFADSQNNDASNIIVLCPNHHRLIHKLNPVFDSENSKFIFPDGQVVEVKLDYHLTK